MSKHEKRQIRNITPIKTSFPLKFIKNRKNTINIALSFKKLQNYAMNVKKGYGQRIKDIRGSLTQTAFGSIIDKSPTSISEYELEDTEPDISTWIKIADYGNKTLDWLLRGENTETLKDKKEKDLINTWREMEKLDPKVAERYKRYGDYELKEIKKEMKDPPSRKSKTLRHKAG